MTVPGARGLRLVACVAVATAVARGAEAQSGAADVVRRGQVHGARPPAGFYETLARRPDAFSFRHGWLERASAVRRNREALRARRAFDLLNAPAAASAPAAATAVTGVLRYPTFLPLFTNTPAADSAVLDSAAVAGRFWGSTPAPPYSVTTYYTELSAGRLTVTGDVIRAFRVSQSDSSYAGGQACQGICPYSGVPRLIADLLQHADSTVDFSRYVDTATGYVPGIVILDPQVGGECYQVYPPAAMSIWAHRYAFSGWTGGPFITNDPWPGHPGQFVRIDDYIIQGGEGGNTGCAPGQLAPIGAVAHETGHLFGLPDLYDVSGASEGLGVWDLMASGNQRLPSRPAHMSAWSLSSLGWVAEVPVTAPQTITTGPVELSDSVFVAPITGTADGEYFVLENRQPIGSDSMMYGPGLMIYHVDTVLMGQRLPYNEVNALAPHALWVVEADSILNLSCHYGDWCWNVGDAGDPFPGSSGNPKLGYLTRPPAASNAGAFAGVVIDSIRQVLPFGAMSFRVRPGSLTVIQASDPGAAVVVDGARTYLFQDFLDEGSAHVVSSDSAQASADRATRYRWVAWSDSGARTHTVTGHLAGGTLTALQAVQYRVLTMHGPLGTIVTSHPPDSTGAAFLPAGTVDTLLAVPVSGAVFVRWNSDAQTSDPLLIIRVTRPFSLGAVFEPRLAVVDTGLVSGVVGASYADTLRMTGGNGYYFYTLQSGSQPPGVALGLDGTFSGVPRKDSTFAFTVLAASGGQSLALPLRITVVAPALAAADVIRQLLRPNGPLTADQLRYLDIIGNNNGRFDLGDVVAWFDKSGGGVSAAAIREMLEKARP